MITITECNNLEKHKKSHTSKSSYRTKSSIVNPCDTHRQQEAQL